MDQDDPQNLHPLRSSDISPAVLLQEIGKNIAEYESMFAVVYDKAGQPHVFMCGDLREMVYAAFVMEQIAGDIAREGGDI